MGSGEAQQDSLRWVDVEEKLHPDMCQVLIQKWGSLLQYSYYLQIIAVASLFHPDGFSVFYVKPAGSRKNDQLHSHKSFLKAANKFNYINPS